MAGIISGVHAIVYTTDAEADRAFFRDVLKFPNVDVGHGWLIFGLPGAELACHPDEKNGRHEIYLMCDDLSAVLKRLAAARIDYRPIAEEPWGLTTRLKLPGGGELGLYQPKHQTALAMR
jgi:hypothetical protein